MPEHLRRRALAALVAEQVAAVFGYPDADAIERSKGFTEMGMSSVMSLDFRSRLGRALGLQLPATFAFEYCSIDAVTDYLALHLQAGPAPVSTEPPGAPRAGARRAARDIRAVAQRADRRAGRGTERYRELLVHRTAGRLRPDRGLSWKTKRQM
ncbi:acyl carrier protein [Pseudomonas aeruginosa]